MNVKKLRNAFDLSHRKTFSCHMGKLYPIACEEVYPGDSFKWNTQMLVRFSPLVAPVMHRIEVFTHFFFVPTRLVWKDFKSFITGGERGNDATPWPYIDPADLGFSGLNVGTLWDYFGLPTSDMGISGIGHVPTVKVSALPFRCYGLIWNEWYRDQNLQDPRVVSDGNGHDETTDLTLASRNWMKDYFTSGLPYPQKGPEALLPLGTSAPIVSATSPTGLMGTDQPVGLNIYGTNGTPAADQAILTAGGLSGVQANDIKTASGQVLKFANTGTPSAHFRGLKLADDLEVDLSEATAASVNDLRLAVQIQRWMERMMRWGSRYIEVILSTFGVHSSDARLQRPEFLGGGRTEMVISEVLQTSATDSGSSTTTPQGTMVGHGITGVNTHAFNKSFEEHGFIICMFSVMPTTQYSQGVSRMWTRKTKHDYYWPDFANLGEQGVLAQEIWAYNDTEEANEAVWAYQGRYDELRSREDSIHGDFRSSLNYWHLSRWFTSMPTLSSQFIDAGFDNPVGGIDERIFANPAGDTIWVQCLHGVTAVRPLPVVAVPGRMDH